MYMWTKKLKIFKVMTVKMYEKKHVKTHKQWEFLVGEDLDSLVREIPGA